MSRMQQMITPTTLATMVLVLAVGDGDEGLGKEADGPEF